MNVHSHEITDEAAIRALIERCAQGFRELDVDAIMDCHTEDVVCFDCHSQFEARGAAAVRTFLEACMPYMRDPIVHNIHELTIETGGDLAFAHYHLESLCHDPEGGKHGGWLRVTLGLRRTAEGWRACHAHISAPFDPMTEKTMFDQPREATPFPEGASCSAS